MTCIAAILESDGIIWIGGDSAGTSEDLIEIRSVHKVFIKDQFIIGCAGSFKLAQIMQYQFKSPKHPKGMSVEEYMNTLFVNQLHKVFNWNIDFNLEPHYLDADFIVGYKRKLFKIGSDLHVAEYIKNYCAIGSGSQVALGSLYSTEDVCKWNPGYYSAEERIKLALEASAYFNNTVSAPFYVLKM